jgi:hypothetical protein
VKTEADYLAVAERLPPARNWLQITVFVTRASTSTALGAGDLLTIAGGSATAAPGYSSSTAVAAADAAASSVLDKSHEVSAVPASSSQEQRSETEGWTVPQHGGGRVATGSGSHSSAVWVWVWVSLLASLCGLSVGYWGWAFLKEELLDTPLTLTGYTLRWRLLPIALILATVAIATTVGVCALKVILRAASCRDQPGAALSAGAAGAVEETPLLQDASPWGISSINADFDAAATAAETEELPLLVGGTAGESGGRDVKVRAGRPDLPALVREAAAQHRSTPRLVVAACGPPELVEAAQDAVTSVRKEGCGVSLCFSGTDSKW